MKLIDLFRRKPVSPDPRIMELESLIAALKKSIREQGNVVVPPDLRIDEIQKHLYGIEAKIVPQNPDINPSVKRIAELERQVSSLQDRIVAQKHVLVPVGGINLQEVAGIRRGSYVSHGGQTGILHKIGADGCEVHMVNEKGETIERREGVQPADMRMAYLNELPWQRIDRGRTHEEALAHVTALGHKDG